jgi:hypothetical protein
MCRCKPLLVNKANSSFKDIYGFFLKKNVGNFLNLDARDAASRARKKKREGTKVGQRGKKLVL